MSNPVPRLHVLLARKAPSAVIIARIRAKLFHILFWDYENDRITSGSVFHGKIYPHRCDLSWDGRHMVYFALNPSRNVFSWTAVCEPPWLKALMMWEHQSTWYGGGVFTSERDLWLDVPLHVQYKNEGHYTPRKNVQRLYDLQFRSNDPQKDDIMWRRMARDGWAVKTRTAGTAICEKSSLSGLYKLTLELNGIFEQARRKYTLLDASMNVLKEYKSKKSIWVDWDNSDRLIIAESGMITRITSINSGETEMIADLSNIET